jgi:hypothetical protein
MSGRFTFLSGDVNYREYGGKWYKREGIKNYKIIELINMDYATGDTAHGKYLVTTTEIDLNQIPKHVKKRACDFCGIDIHKADELNIAECVHAYGAGLHLDDSMGNNYLNLLREARSI